MGAVQPIIAAGLAALLFRERLHANVAIAGLIGIVGVALLVLHAGAQLDTLGVVAGIAGATSMATGVVLTKRWGRPVPLAAFTSWQLIAGGLMLTPLALILDGAPATLTARNLIGFAWLATGGTTVAYLLWFHDCQAPSTSQVSLLGLASPIVRDRVRMDALHQTLTTTQLIGGAFVLAALWYGQRPDRPTRDRGLQPVRVDEWRAGTAPFPSVRVSGTPSST